MKYFFSLLTVLCLIFAGYSSLVYAKTSYAQSKTAVKADKVEKKELAKPQSAVEDEPAAAVEATGIQEENKADSQKTGENTPDEGLYTYKPPVPEETSYGWLIFKTMVVLILMIGGFYLFLKFVMNKNNFPGIGRNVVHVIAVAPMGPNKTIQVIEISNKLLVLGVTDQNINLIKEITDKDDIDRIKLLSSKSSDMKNFTFQDFISEQITGISRAIRNFTSKRKGKGRDDFSERFQEFFHDRNYDYMKNQKDRLKKLNGDGHDE